MLMYCLTLHGDSENETSAFKSMISMIERKDIISEYEQTGSIRAVARNLGIHRQTVKNYVKEYLAAKAGGDESLTAYLKSEPSYKVPQRDRTVLTDEVRALINVCLRDNEEKRRRGDRKLCMKASDIHTAVGYAGFKVSYSSVCKYIRTTLGHTEETEECFIRQRYKPGQDCEFDWGEMYLTIDGRRIRLYMAVFTMAYSNYRAAYLFLHQDTQAFLESHRRFFREVGHVPHRMVYDNMRVAVKSFVGGKHPTDALIRLEAAYGFTHRFCNAHRGNEKGHVERSVEVVRRAAFCQVDTFESITAAQMQAVYACSGLNVPLDMIEGSAEQKMEEEWEHMLPLVREVGCFEQQEYTVDKYSTIVVGKVHYSVPDHLVGKKVTALLYSNAVKVWYRGKAVCEHERTPLNGWKLDIMHYLRTLQRKPGAVAGSVALYMLRDDLRLIFESHFSESPADFIILLQKTRDRGLGFDDVVEAEKKIRRRRQHVTLDAFNQALFSEENRKQGKDMHIGVSSRDIEKCAMDSLKGVAALLESGISSHGHNTHRHGANA